MKVRLKPSLAAVDALSHNAFQFHEGPIKTCYTLPFIDYNVVFQFHEGPIKTNTQIMQLQAEGSFNSMKVRLKPAYGAADASHAAAFQFHEGPIKTPFGRRSP